MNRAPLGRVVHLLRRLVRQLFVEPRAFALRVRMACWVVLVSSLARVTTLPRVQRIAAFGVGRSRPQGHRRATPEQLGSAIDSVLGIGILVFRPRCWKRAIVLHRFLALNGIESRINFGVRKASGGAIDGHAWLECEGRPLLEDRASEYVVTFSLPHDPAGSAMLPLGPGLDRLG